MTDRLDLPQRYRNVLEGLLREHVPDAEVWAYGSRITGESHEGSDLDLVVRGPGLEPLGDGFFRLLEAIEESNIPILVQAHDWARLPESFHREIERDYVVLQTGTNLHTQSKTRKLRGATLGDIAEIVMGHSPPGESVTEDEGVALLNGPTEFGPNHPTPVQFTIDARRMAHRRDILFCVRGSTTGRMNWADQEYAIGRGVAAIRHREDPALQPFVRGVIELALPSLLAGATGSTFPNVSRAQIAGIHIPDLTIEEQLEIAHILGTLDDKIELNRRMNETLEEMARALFKSWFVDFDPVHAKAALNQHPASVSQAHPAQRGADGEKSSGWTIERARAYLEKIDPSIAALFPDRFVESELGDIPEGWEVKALGDELQSLASGTRPRGGAVGAGIPSIGAENVDGLGRYDYSKEKYIPTDFFNRLRSKGAVVQNGDVLLYKDGAHIGRKTYVDRGFPHSTCAVNEHVLILRLRITEAQRFLFFWLDQDWITEEIVGLNSNSAQPGINQRGVKSLPLLFPSLEILRRFDQQTRHLTDRLFANCHQALAHSRIRDILLPKLVSGEVRLRNIAAISNAYPL